MKKTAATLSTFLLFAAACGDGGDLPPGIVPDAAVIAPDAGPGSGTPDAGPTGPTDPAPTLNSINPASGPETGGTRVLLRGTSFIEPAEVFFGDAPATSVVVLDEVTVAATSPIGTVGPATVRVVTPGGEAELPAGFTYVRELLLESVEPARVPDEGGIEVTVRGRGFDSQTIVLLDRTPLRGPVLIGDTEIRGWMPALAAGRPEIRVVNRDAEVRRSDLLVVFATPEITAVAPGFGSIDGGDEQALAGEGFDGAASVVIGGVSATSFSAASDDRIEFVAPALAEGPHDVVVSNGDASAMLAGGYIAVDETNPDLAVLGVTPSRVSTDGGTLITIVGRGFGADTQVTIAGQRVAVESLGEQGVVVAVPAGLPTGPQDVTVISGGSQATANAAFTLYRPISVAGIDPRQGPVEGGTAVTITGLGFLADAEVRIAGVPLTDVVVVSDQEITATTVAGAAGAFDVEVRTADTRAVLRRGFTFTAPFEVIRVEPDEGSVAGNTYVSVIGRGFTGPASVSFGGVPGVDAQLENGAVIGVRTPPSRAGRVDVAVAQAAATATISQAYRFFDPRLLTGGAWGGEIEGAVNVAVGDFSGQPIPGMVVQVGFDADPALRAVTDENGLATISSPDIRGPQTITAGLTGYEHVTFAELNSENLTILASRHPESIGEDDPRAPCPAPAQPPQIRGRIFKLKSSLDPQTSPDVVPVVRITYTDANVFSPNPPDPLGLDPSQVAFVVEEGGEYAISVLRVGSVGVYAVLGDLNTTTQVFTPKKMGFARGVPVAPDSITEGIDISLDFDMDASTQLRLDNPPDQQPGPSLNAIFPYLNLDSDGVVPFPATIVSSSGLVNINNLPNVAENAFFYLGGSFTFDSNTGALQIPYSLTLVESAESFESGVDLGPFLEMPTNVKPKAGELLESGRFSWEIGGTIPDVTTLSVVDVRGITNCCCDDLQNGNANGQCDEGEADVCSTAPQQFNRWSVYAPGNLQSYDLPRMPLDVQAFEPPRTYGYLLELAVAPRFSYREFVFNQFNPFFWQSWAVYSSFVLVKEETD